MSENGSSRRNSGFDGNPAQNQAHRKKQDEEAQLEKIWKELDDSEEGEEIDPERFLRDMAVLDELVPLPDFDLAASWQAFREKHGELLGDLDPADQQSSASALEERPKRRRSVKPIRAVLVMVLILAMLMMASCGILDYIIRAIANWSDQVFHYEVTQELRVEDTKPKLPDTQQYDSLDEALVAYGVDAVHSELLLPEGYSLQEMRILEYTESIKFLVVYASGENEIAFTIWHYKDSTSLEHQAAEKLPADAEVYARNGVKYYVMKNTETITISWIAGNELYRIAGGFSAEEVEAMIDSIYEGSDSHEN